MVAVSVKKIDAGRPGGFQKFVNLKRVRVYVHYSKDAGKKCGSIRMGGQPPYSCEHLIVRPAPAVVNPIFVMNFRWAIDTDRNAYVVSNASFQNSLRKKYAIRLEMEGALFRECLPQDLAYIFKATRADK